MLEFVQHGVYAGDDNLTRSIVMIAQFFDHGFDFIAICRPVGACEKLRWLGATLKFLESRACKALYHELTENNDPIGIGWENRNPKSTGLEDGFNPKEGVVGSGCQTETASDNLAWSIKSFAAIFLLCSEKCDSGCTDCKIDAGSFLMIIIAQVMRVTSNHH
uniref:Uncharacterized protein n=1 Tax=Romanomermis culicivorax TaxID=13658 RepID=A0A915HSX2_ROMCU